MSWLKPKKKPKLSVEDLKVPTPAALPGQPGYLTTMGAWMEYEKQIAAKHKPAGQLITSSTPLGHQHQLYAYHKKYLEQAILESKVSLDYAKAISEPSWYWSWSDNTAPTGLLKSTSSNTTNFTKEISGQFIVTPQIYKQLMNGYFVTYRSLKPPKTSHTGPPPNLSAIESGLMKLAVQ